MRRQKHIRYLIVMFVVASGLLTSLLFAETIKGAYRTTAEVALRSGPDMNYPVVTTLPKGIKINVVGREGYWLRVESKHGGAPGYIDEQFAEPETAAQEPLPIAPAQAVAGAYRTLVDVDLRQGPGTNYPLVVKLPSGIKIHVVRAEGDWLRVESKRGGKPGYVEKRFVERWSERY